MQRSAMPSNESLVTATIEEVAEMMSAQEGRRVTVNECRMLEFKAMRKVKAKLEEMGLKAKDLLPGHER